MDRAPPPPPVLRVSMSPHGGGTLYTPESLHQWRLARQQKQQLSPGTVHNRNSCDTVPRDQRDGITANPNGRADQIAGNVGSERAASSTSTPWSFADALASDDTRSTETSDTGGPHHCDDRRQHASLHRDTLNARPPRRRNAASSGVSHFDVTTTHDEEVSTETSKHPVPTRSTPVDSSWHARSHQRLVESLENPLEAQTQLGGPDVDQNQPPNASETTQATTCRVGWCMQPPKRHGLCWNHGGEKKCCRVDCGRPASDGEFCTLHLRQLQR